MSTYLHILREVGIFQDLDEERLKRVAGICQERTYEMGTLIFAENTASQELYVIAQGAVDIQVDPAILGIEREGLPGPTTITTLQRGQVFGEVALADEGLRSASARCASKTARLLVISREDLIRLCEEDSWLGYLVMRNVAAELALKIRHTDLMVREQLLWRPRFERKTASQESAQNKAAMGGKSDED